MALTEPQVVEQVHAFLKQRPVARLYTDSHDSLRGRPVLEPYQRFTVDLGEFVVHPDLVALEADGETLVAVEAKGSGHRDAFIGMTQAELYEIAFHRTYLAADATSIGERLTAFARLKNVGLFAIGDSVRVLHEPEPRLPVRDAHRAIIRQLDITDEVADRLAFTYNLPTHYLVWAIALDVGQTYSRDEARAAVATYPLPDDLESALRGARSLGILRSSLQAIALSETGAAIKLLLPTTLAEWANIHRRASTGERAALSVLCPPAGAALRLLLLRHATVGLLIEGLKSLGGSGFLTDLALACDRLDHTLAPVVFLTPAGLVDAQDDRGRIDWHAAGPGIWRIATGFQLKSVLRGGMLSPATRLGSSTSPDPGSDFWSLNESPSAQHNGA
jgi:hypothetical protein